MSKHIQNFKIMLAFFLLITMGCNKNDDPTGPISLQNVELSHDENPNTGETLGIIQTTGGTAINFSITSQSPSGALHIDPTSGALTVADASLFDFETNAIITATVTADNADNSVTVTINLNNLSEITAQDLDVTMDENPVLGQVIGSLQTMGNASGFAITSQSPAGAMAIDPNSSELTVADASLFDYETDPTLTATVAIEDAENVVTVTVNLNNVVEIMVQDLTVAVDENPTDGQVLGTLQANGNGSLDFSISSQSPMGAMAIDAATGELTVIDPNLFDYETHPVMTAAIAITDGSEIAMATVTLDLNDVDEVSAQNTDLSIDENPSNGDVIGALQASGSNLTYTLTFQNPAGAFTIDQSTGELSVADETLFDFETTPDMLATISVSNGIQSVSANAFVTLNDQNEIGEFKFGGVIFWIDPNSNNSEGLVCDINDMPNPNAPSGITWSEGANMVTGATGTAIGTGEANTSAIVANHSSGTYAAWLCAAHQANGYSDWYLPSLFELLEIQNKMAIISTTAQAHGGSALTGLYHWSSTEMNLNEARVVGTSNDFSSGKNNSAAMVRAVRTWTDF